MILNLTNLMNYKKLVGVAAPKTGIKDKDMLYFDFKQNKIFIHGDFMVAYINFSYTRGDNELCENIFFETKKLFIILDSMQDSSNIVLTFTQKGLHEIIPRFSYNKDNFIIEHTLKETIPFEITPISDTIEFKLTDYFINLIQESSQFVDQYNDTQYNAIAINNEGIYALNIARFYECKTNFFTVPLKEKEFIMIHRDIAKFIISLNEEDNCICTYSNNKIRFAIENIFEFIFAIPYSHTEIPSAEDKAEVITTTDKIVINKELLADTLKFFEPFYIETSKPIRLTVLSNTEIELASVSDFDVLKKIILIKQGNFDLVGFMGEYNGSTLKMALSVLTTEDIDIFMSFKKSGILLTSPNDFTKTIGLIKYDIRSEEE